MSTTALNYLLAAARKHDIKGSTGESCRNEMTGLQKGNPGHVCETTVGKKERLVHTQKEVQSVTL